MKRYTHAWLALMATKRLEDTTIESEDRKYADSLVRFLKGHRDDVTQGAWYPDAVIMDMANSHVLKLTPSDGTPAEFRSLPETYLSQKLDKKSPLRKKSFVRADKKDNLPDRCESITESVVDHLKIQESEDKGSPVSPTDNQVALLLFILSHYIADAHMPFHCDARAFSTKGRDLHGKMEGVWDDTIRACYQIDEENERFIYDPRNYPMKNPNNDLQYQASFLKKVDDALGKRKFVISFGGDNNNVWDFMSAVCQHSYLLSYCFIPSQYDHTNVPLDNWQSLGSVSFEDLSVAVFSDAIDSIARIWLRLWRRYKLWEVEKEKQRPDNA